MTNKLETAYGAEVQVAHEEERTPGKTAEQQGGAGSQVPQVFGEFSCGAETCISPCGRSRGEWQEWGTNYNPAPV